VEGAPGSGSTITVNHAADIGRDVLAVPGPITSPLSDVPHRLIREGALLVRGAPDVLAALKLDGGVESADLDRLTEEERTVLGTVTGTGVTADSVTAQTGLPAGKVLVAMVGLELRGLVRETGGRYRRTTISTG
jgi:DNA processing protein